MKTKMFLIGLACLVGVTLFAQSPGLSAWTSSGGFTGGGGGSYTVGVSNYCVGSTKSSLGQTAYATFISVTSDLAGSTLILYQDQNPANGYPAGLAALTNATTALYMNPVYDASGTNIVSGATNGLVVGNPVVIRHLKNDNYEVRYVSAIVASNQVTLAAAPTTAVSPGDMVFPMVIAGNIPVGSATVTLGPADFIACQTPNAPFLCGIQYTTAGKINVVSGRYLP